MKKILSDKLYSIIFAALIIVIGIGFCVSMAAGVNLVAWVTGLVIIAYGVINIIGALNDKKSLSVKQAIVGVALLVFGIFYIKYELVDLIIAYAPWLVAGVGVVAFAFMLVPLFNKALKKDEEEGQ